MSPVHRQPGLVSYVDVGCAVWSTTRSRATSNDVIPVGGVVVGVTESHAGEGEIARSFLVFDHETTKPRLEWTILPESDVDRTLIEALDLNVLRRACKDLANEVAFEQPYHRRAGAPSPIEVRAVHALAALIEVIVGDEPRSGSQRVLNPNAVAAMWRDLIADVLAVPGPITTGMAQRVFAAEELVALIYGAGGILHVDDPRPAAPAFDRPVAPVNISALVD